MSYNNPRITLQDTSLDMITKLAEGNPGAVVAVIEMMKSAPVVDPDSAFGAFAPLFDLDTLDIYGSRIHVLYKYVARGDVVLVLGLLRAVQLGHMGESELHAAIANPREFTDERGQQLLALVKADLPDFGVRS